MMYGHKWHTAYGPADDGTWSHALSVFTLEQIGAGMRKLVAHNDPWPPTLPEFVALCRDDRALEAHRERKALSKPQPNQAIAERHFREMRKILGAAK